MQVLRDEALASAARDSRIRGHEASQSRRGRVKSLAVIGLAVVSVGLAVSFVSQTWPFAGSASHGAGTLQGTLFFVGGGRRAAGTPLHGDPGILVRVQSADGSTVAAIRTDANGAYRVHAPAGTYRVSVHCYPGPWSDPVIVTIAEGSAVVAPDLFCDGL